MKNFKTFGLTMCLGLCLAATAAGSIAVNEVYAEEATNAVSVTTNFSALAAMSDETAIVESQGVSVCADATHGAIPSTAWGDPFQIADQSYMIYEVKATDVGANQVFDTLKVNINARLWNQNDGTAHNENAINVYVGTSPATATYLVKSYGPGEVNTGAAFADFPELDLSTIAAGYGAAYIKVELKQTKNATCGKAKDAHDHGACGTVASSDGYIGIWNAGVKLNTISISATTKEGEVAVTPDYTLSSDFTANKLDACNVYEAVGVASDGNEHGLITAEGWDAWVKIPTESYVVYKLSADKGKAFASLTMDISAKLWNQNDGDSHNNNKINVYLSPDGTNWTDAVATVGCGDVPDTNLNVSDFELPYIADASYKTVYVKIGMVQNIKACGVHMLANSSEHHGTCGSGCTTADGYMELWHLGIKLYSVAFEGSYKDLPLVTVNYNDGETTLYTDEYQEKDTTLVGYTPAEKDGYEFKGWYLDQELTTEVPADYIATESVTLYAKYEAVTYAINYVLDGGVNAEGNPATYTASDLIALQVPTKEGYEFKGWYTTADFSGDAVVEINGETKADIALYAKWEQLPVDPGTSDEPTTSEPTTSEPTTSEPTTSEPTTSEPAEKKDGCGSTIGSIAGGVVALGIAAVALFKKKED